MLLTNNIFESLWSELAGYNLIHKTILILITRLFKTSVLNLKILRPHKRPGLTIHIQHLAYRCSLPGLTEFTVLYCMRPGLLQGLVHVAEREGFEPSVPLLAVHAISNRAPSASRASLLTHQYSWWRRGRDTNPRSLKKDSRFRVGPVMTTSVPLLTFLLGKRSSSKSLPDLPSNRH